MKKLTFLLVIVLLGLSTIFTSCKKGEEDPTLSLASRKARLTNSWILNAGDWTIENYNSKAAILPGFDLILDDSKGTIRTNNFHYEENELTVKDDRGNMYVYSPYEYKMTFNKDNTFEISIHQKYTFDYGYEEDWYTYKGYWYFLDGVKELDVPDKERVFLEVRSFYYKELRHYDFNGDTFDDVDEGTTEFEGTSNNTQNLKNSYILDLKRLASKEIILNLNEKYTDEDGDYTKISGEMTFVPSEE